MPLHQEFPRIDDRDFDDLRKELKARIPRYTDEWTDVNESDPGTTLIELFAWLAEMQLYRMNKVPQLNYLKFLELLGIELQPAMPARTEITFATTDAPPGPVILVPPGTQVSADTDEGPLIFETERPLYALAATIADILVDDGVTRVSHRPPEEGPADPFHPFTEVPQTGRGMWLGFASDGDFPGRVEIDLAIEMEVERAAPAAVSCSSPARVESAQLAWDYWDGREWLSLEVLEDETRAFARSGHVFLRSPEAGAMARHAFGPSGETLFWIRVRILTSSYESAPRIESIRTNTVPAIQAETILGEVLGGSDGTIDQEFFVESTPVLAGSLEITVDATGEDDTWSEVADLIGSSPGDPHFVVNRTTGRIRFGNGRNGAVPGGNPDNLSNITATRYRSGGGAIGNVAAGAVSQLLRPIDGIDDGGVANVRAAHSGRDEETLEEALRRAPAALRSQERTVTASDFEAGAREVGAIRRAKALPLHHPDFPGAEIPGVVSVIVVPEGDRPDPIPSEASLRAVCEHLEPRRLLTTELYVLPPRYRHVEVIADVFVNSNVSALDVKEAIVSALSHYLHPLTGGDEGTGWPFGGTVFFSRLFQRIFEVGTGGVDAIERLALRVDGVAIDPCTDVPIGADELVYSTDHEVQILFDRDHGRSAP